MDKVLPESVPVNVKVGSLLPFLHDIKAENNKMHKLFDNNFMSMFYFLKLKILFTNPLRETKWKRYN